MKPWTVVIVSAVIGAAWSVCAYHGWTHHPRPIDTSTLISKAELDAGTLSLDEQANAAILDRVTVMGMKLVDAKIVARKVDGSRAVVVMQVDYRTPRAGSRPTRTYVTVILHRSVWQVGQMNQGAPDGMEG